VFRVAAEGNAQVPPTALGFGRTVWGGVDTRQVEQRPDRMGLAFTQPRGDRKGLGVVGTVVGRETLPGRGGLEVHPDGGATDPTTGV
jgi:hypothetical protein